MEDDGQENPKRAERERVVKQLVKLLVRDDDHKLLTSKLTINGHGEGQSGHTVTSNDHTCTQHRRNENVTTQIG